MIESLLQPSFLSLLFGFFTAGLIGSWHCGLMCGPTSCFVASKKQLIPYHIGRMLSYVLAGVFAGSISNFLLKSYDWLKYLSVAVLCVIVIVSYLKNNQSFRTPKFIQKIYFKHNENAFLLGFLSLLLPCGWLYTFIVSALASQSAWAGALVMFVFWLSTLPALSMAQILLRKLIEKNDFKHQKIASLVLMIASLFSLLTFLTHY
ncbi:MAG: sulfite exporter TauE/SafE family protein [Pseudobdellovibrio sp.]